MNHRHARKGLCFTALTAALLSAGLAGAQSKSLPGTGQEAVPADYLESMVELCEGCHGPGGASRRDDVPSLAGRPADELMAELERFYFYERHCPDVEVGASAEATGKMSMCDVTNQMSRSEALALAEHFASSGR